MEENVKQFMQEKDGWCGPAVLSYALHEQGKEVSQETIAKETKTTVDGGVDPAPLAEAAKHHGMDTHVFSDVDPEELLTSLAMYRSEGWSVILDYLAGDDTDDGHYVALREVKPNVLEVFDPGEGGSRVPPEGGGVKELKKDRFIAHWRDKTKDGETFRYWALILIKKP